MLAAFQDQHSAHSHAHCKGDPCQNEKCPYDPKGASVQRSSGRRERPAPRPSASRRQCWPLLRSCANGRASVCGAVSAGEGTHPRGSARLPVRGSPFGLARVRGAAQVRGLREQGPRRRTHPRPNRPRPRHSFPRAPEGIRVVVPQRHLPSLPAIASGTPYSRPHPEQWKTIGMRISPCLSAVSDPCDGG